MGRTTNTVRLLAAAGVLGVCSASLYALPCQTYAYCFNEPCDWFTWNGSQAYDLFGQPLPAGTVCTLNLLTPPKNICGAMTVPQFCCLEPDVEPNSCFGKYNNGNDVCYYTAPVCRSFAP